MNTPDFRLHPPSSTHDPPRLSPPPGDPSNKNEPGRRWVRLLGAVVIALSAIALLVLFYLPHGLQKGDVELQTVKEQKIEPALNATVAIPAKELKEIRYATVSARDRWYERKAEAELENMAAYAGDAFSRALELGKKGAESFSRGSFEDAARLFDAAAVIIEKIHASRDEILASALEAGGHAIDDGNGTAAARFFRIALAVEPDSAAALEGMGRAEHAEEVHGLLEQGRQLMENQDFPAAAKSFSKALAIDPRYLEAKSLLEEAEQGASRQKFDRFMGDAIAALSAGRYAEAMRAVEAARRLFPQEKAAIELSARIRAASRASDLKRTIALADSALRQEEWKRAAELYERALKIAPHSVEAREGGERAKRLLTLHKSLQEIVSDPWRLRDRGPYDDAVNTVRIAGAIQDAGPKLKMLAAEAGNIVERWRRKVSVVFVSDENTSVVIYRVGKLGRFQRRVLKLRPGIYTVAGMREGFRDVLKKVKVAPGADGMQVQVACTDRI